MSRKRKIENATSAVENTISVSAACGVEKDGVVNSVEDLAHIFAQLDPFRDILESALQGWAPPCVIVVGTESSGKSSVLERLTMMSLFPRADGICTRMPIHAQLRRTTADLPLVLEIKNLKTKKSTKRIIPVNGGHINVRAAMEECLKAENKRVTGVSKEHIIILHISNPRVPSIDLVDLPGIVAGSAAGEPSDMSVQTLNLAKETIREFQDRAIFLGISRATQATNNDFAFGFLQELNLQVFQLFSMLCYRFFLLFLKLKYLCFVDISQIRWVW